MVRSARAKLVLLAVVVTLAAFSLSVSSSSSASAMNWNRLNRMQKRLASGALSIALAPPSSSCTTPTGDGAPSRDDEGDENDNQCPPNRFSAPSDNAGGRTGSFTPTGSGECSNTFGRDVKVNQNCQNITDPDLAGRGQAQNETSIAIDPNNPNHLIASQNDYRRGDGNCYGAYSFDNGRTWNDTTIPMSFTRGAAFGGAQREYWQAGGDTSVDYDTKGNAYFSCQVFNRGNSVSPNQDQSSAFYVFRSTGNNGASWNFPGRPVAENNDVAGAGNVLEDKQLLTVDNHRGSPFQDRVYVTWTEFAADGTGLIWESFSNDYGEHFSPRHLVSATSPLCTNTFGLPTEPSNCNENQFSQPFTGPDGALYVTWANFNEATVGNDNRSQMLMARSTDGGNTFSAPVKVSDYYDLPDCDTYQGEGADPGRACVPEKGPTSRSVFRATNYPSGAVDPTDPQRVVITFGSYINRDSNERNGCVPAGFSPTSGQALYTGVKVPGSCNNDILVSVSNDAGATFTGTTTDPRAEATVNPDRGQRTTDQFWQWEDFTRNGKLAVSYYDRQYGNDEFVGNSDISLSGGDAFRQRVVRVTSSSMPPPTQFGGQFYGDYSGLAAFDTAHPDWMDTRDPELFLCPGTGTPGNPPRVCTGTYQAGTPNAEQANDQNIYTATVGVSGR
jgi:hypothetical protein